MQEITAFLESVAGRIYNALEARIVTDPLGLPFIETPDDRLYLPYLVSFFAISFGIYVFRDKTKLPAQGENSNFFNFLFPRNVYRHPSAIADFKFYIVNRVFGFLFLSSLLALGAYAAGPVGQLAETLFGPSSHSWDGQSIGQFQLLYFIALYMAGDLAFYLSHYLHHKSRFFWEFHKVHHSAEVLTPITNYRSHPMEKLTLVLITGLFTGVVIGIFGYLFGRDIGSPDYLALTLVNASLTAFLFRILANHRHSHIWLSYGPVLEHAFISPAQHQIHHSCEDRHLDTNFGLQLAVWDWVFGTLYVPKGREEFVLGLQDREHEQYHSVLSLYFLPFKKAAYVLQDYATRGYTTLSRFVTNNSDA